jgi:hypothetical protein
MKQQTAVEWLVEQLKDMEYDLRLIPNTIKQAKAMEAKEKLKHQLFIGKVTEILGFDKTVELLKECNNEIL